MEQGEGPLIPWRSSLERTLLGFNTRTPYVYPINATIILPITTVSTASITRPLVFRSSTLSQSLKSEISNWVMKHKRQAGAQNEGIDVSGFSL